MCHYSSSKAYLLAKSYKVTVLCTSLLAVFLTLHEVLTAAVFYVFAKMTFLHVLCSGPTWVYGMTKTVTPLLFAVAISVPRWTC